MFTYIISGVGIKTPIKTISREFALARLKDGDLVKVLLCK